MTTVINFGNSDGWLEAIWCEIECRADSIIAELNDIKDFYDQPQIERDGCEHPACPEFDEVCLNIKSLVRGFDLCAFHATRALSPDGFFENGLKILDKNRLIGLMEDIRGSTNIPGIKDIFEGCEIPNDREGKVYLSLKDPKVEPREFKEFWCRFGGEILGEILCDSSLDSDEITQIRALGSPFIVECHIPFKNLDGTKADVIAKGTIRHTLNIYKNQRLELELPDLNFLHDICPEYIHQVCMISVECEAH